jgi:hypothetical protein
MKHVFVCSFALLALGCSSSSPSADDFGPVAKDASAAHDAKTEKEHHDAGLVCDPVLPKDAGNAKDGETDGEATEAASHVGDAMAEAGDAGHPTCLEACAIASPAGYEKFLGYQLTDCGCTAGGECYSACHTSSSASPMSDCGMCLAAQTAEGLSSTCTLTAAEDCSNDTVCAPFQTCAGKCPM